MGEIRSLLSPNFNVLDLIVTTMKCFSVKVFELVGLVNPLMTAVSPCKPNIFYSMSGILYNMHNFCTTSL